MSAEQKAVKTIFLSIVASVVLTLVKAFTGWYGNSYALIADSIESCADVFSSLLVLIGLKYALKPADNNHPYGHGKAEPLLTFIAVGFLITSALIIIRQSIINIQTPHELPKPYTIIVLGIITIVKEGFYRYSKKKAKESGSTAVEADAWHHRSDAITSLAAFFGISYALYMGKGYEAADDWAALLASGIILYNSFLIFRPALGEIMDEHVYDDLVSTIREKAKLVEGVLDTEKCFVRKSGFKYYVDLHIEVDGGISVYHGHEIAHRLKSKLLNDLPQLANVLIHVEPDHK